MEFEFAKPLSAILNGLRQGLYGLWFRNICAAEPGKPSRRPGHIGLDLLEGAAAGEQIGFGDACTVEMRQIVLRFRPQMKMEIENGRTPSVALCLQCRNGRTSGY